MEEEEIVTESETAGTSEVHGTLGSDYKYCPMLKLK